MAILALGGAASRPVRRELNAAGHPNPFLVGRRSRLRPRRPSLARGLARVEFPLAAPRHAVTRRLVRLVTSFSVQIMARP